MVHVHHAFFYKYSPKYISEYSIDVFGLNPVDLTQLLATYANTVYPHTPRIAYHDTAETMRDTGRQYQ